MMTTALAYCDDTFQASTITLTASPPGERRRLSPASVAFTGREADWQGSAMARLAVLLSLPTGWDGHGGRPTTMGAATYAIDVLSRVMRSGVPAPSIVPLSYGGVQLEWHRMGWDIELEVPGPGRLHVLTRNIAADEEEEFELRADLSRLSSVVTAIQD